MKNELELVVLHKQGEISVNFEELKEQLKNELEIYKNMVFTEDDKQGAKNSIVELRKLRKSIDDERKNIKKEFNKPLAEFEENVKKLLTLVDEPIALIDSKVAEFEVKRVEEKKIKIAEIYNEIMANNEEIKDYIELSKVYQNYWLNVSTTEKAIRSDISEVIVSLKNGIEMIKTFHTDCEEKAIQMFVKSYDITPVITFINQFEQQKREILAKQEEERKEKERLEEIKRIEEEKKAKEVQPAAVEEIQPPTEFVEIFEEIEEDTPFEEITEVAPFEVEELPFVQLVEEESVIIKVKGNSQDIHDIKVMLDSMDIVYTMERGVF